MITRTIRRILEQNDVSLRDRKHAESVTGDPLCEAEGEGAFVVDDPADADCPACRLLAFGPGGLH